MNPQRSLGGKSSRLLLVAILIGMLTNPISVNAGQPNAGSAWSQKEQKSGVIAPKQFSHSELVSIAQRLQQLRIIGSAPGTPSSHSSVLVSLAQKRTLANGQFDTTLAATHDWNIRLNERNGTPIFVSNLNFDRQSLSLSASASEAQVAVSFVDRYKGLFQLDSPTEELVPVGTTSDKLGMKHVRLQQAYGGIPIWGHEIIAHLVPSGSVYAVSARYCPTPRNLDLTANRISADEAISVAKSDLTNMTEVQTIDSSVARLLNYSGPRTKLYIWVNDSTQEPRVAWFVELRPNVVDDWYYFVDAGTGELLHKYNNTNYDGPSTAPATDLNGVVQTLHTYQIGSTYYLIDASQPIWQATQPDILNDARGALVTISFQGTDAGPWVHLTSLSNTWTDPVAVSAHSNLAKVFQYYYATFGRRGIDDSSTTIGSIIHVTQSGHSYDGACWSSGAMLYGDGGSRCKPLAGALDVAAHEMTHGVIQNTVNLKYENQSGALNESFADVFGCMVDRSNWLMGENVAKSAYYPSGAIRNLADPHNGGTSGDGSWQPANMSEYSSDTSDFGGVHLNSGIPSKAAYLIGSSIGRSELEQIYYRILDARYLTSEAHFIDMRLWAVQAATDLYGSASNEVTTVKAAFDAVGIFDGTGTQQPSDAPATAGDQWVAVVNAETNDNSLYKAKPDSSGTIIQLTTTQVLASTGRPMSVAADGSGVVFIDSSHFIRTILMDGSGEQVISATGVWRSLSFSPNMRKLAATTIYEDSTIYIFDLQYPDSTKAVRLYSPTTQQGISSYNVRYADVLDWNRTGDYLIYDALSGVPQSGGGSINSWSIFLLNVGAGTIQSLYPPLPPGIQMGNPAFGNTNDIYVVCDLMNTNTATDYVYAVNLFSGAAGLVENNGNSIGFPDYSTDDRRIVFQQVVAGRTTLRQINLDSTKITPAGASFSWLIDAALPSWFVIPAPVDVNDPTDNRGLPNAFSLSQNYPNPFNPSTRIDFTLPRAARVSLDVFNVLGQKIRTLALGLLTAGHRTITWDGTNDQRQVVSTGVYFYRLTAGEYVESKKMVLLK